MRIALLVSTSLSVALGLAGAASAQDAAGGAQAIQLQEVVVTAQRRPENVQKSNLAIAVVGGDQLRRTGVADPKDLNNAVPGMTIAQRGSNTQVFIRGIGDNSATGLSVSAVAVNIDGVYIDRPTAVTPNFYDLERIEVLKGPQGTLYGRNASGGALNLITARPDGKTGGYIDLEAGNYNLWKAAGAYGAPINDQVSVRGAFQVVKRDGYLSDGYNDQDTKAGRLQVLWKPNDDVSLRVSADAAHIGGKGAGTVIMPRPAGFDPWKGSSTPEAQAYIVAASRAAVGPVNAAAAFPPQGDGFMRNDTANISAELNWKLGWATLTVIPAYRHMKLDYVTYEPGGYYHDIESADQSTLEARLSNQTDRLKWTLGLYGFDEDQSINQFNLVNKNLFANWVPIPKIDTKAWAVFGEATYSVTPALRVIGGMRYTEETKDIAGKIVNTFGLPAGVVPFPEPKGVPLNNSLSNDSTNFKAGAEYDLTPQSMVYATVSTGFKAGGFYPGAVPNSYGPERLTAYEFGSRNRFLDNRLQVNLEGFYWQYKDLQQSRSAFGSDGQRAFVTINAGEAKLYGANLDVQFKLTQADTLTANVEYIHATYDSFAFDVPTGAAIPGATTSCPVGGAHPGALGLSVQTINCAGYDLQRTPQWSANAGYQHEFDLGDAGRLTFNVSAAYASSRYLSIDFINFMKAKSTVTEDAYLTYAPAKGNWTLTGWVKNISDEAVYTAAVQYAFARNLAFANINPPRTFGARLHFAF